MMRTLRAVFVAILLVFFFGGLFSDALLSPLSATRTPDSFVTLLTPLHDATMRFLGGGVRFVRDKVDEDPSSQVVKIIWIDDAALSPQSQGGYGPLSSWDRSIYRDAFRFLERFGAKGVALDVLLSKNGQNDDVLIEFGKNTSLPITIATTQDASVTDPLYTTTSLQTGSVDIVRAMTNRSDIVIGYESATGNLASVLTQGGSGGVSGAKYFLYEPHIEGVSILCLSMNPPRACPPPAWYRDAYIVVATSAIAMNDMFPTPYGWAYGGEMHAWSLSQMLNQSSIVYISDTTMAGLWLMSCIAYMAGYFLRTRGYFLVVLLMTLSMWCGIILLWSYGYFHTGLIWWVLTSGIALMMLAVYLWIGSVQKSQYLHTLLGGYLSSGLAQDLSNRRDEYDLQKTLELSPKRVVTLFADIEDFTSVSEGVDFAHLKQFLDWYTDRISAIFLDHGGYIDKFLGDGVMALWGAFDTADTSREQASEVLGAVREIQELLAEHAEHIASLLGRPIRMRFGISYGEALVGVVGDIHQKQSYTAFGDAINTASRLESLNKIYTTHVLYSQAFHDLIAHLGGSYFVDQVCLKGKQSPTRVYTQWQLDPQAQKLLEHVEPLLVARSLGQDISDQGAAQSMSELRGVIPEVCLTRWRSILSGSEQGVRILSEK